MDERKFWNNNSCISAVMESADKLISDSYMWVINLKTKEAWCPKNTQDFFGLDLQIYTDFVNIMAELVYPYDRNEFIEGMNKRISLQTDDRDLCVRLHDHSNQYHMFSFFTDTISDRESSSDYLLVILKNENVFNDYDPLTYLYSYNKYTKDFPTVVSTYKQVAILKIGIEAFNNYHIIYGTDYANRILKQIALEFIYMMDDCSAVYRLDGESFLFILKNCSRDGLIEFEAKIRNKLCDGITVDSNKVILKTSSGAILLDNYDGEASDVLGKVSYAHNHSSKEHQGQLIIFNDEVRTTNSAELELMRVIHQSVRNDCIGFYLEYQPIVASDTGSIVGAEALVRWRKEPYGSVPPRMFIEWMETDPSMYELGNFVLRTALTETLPLLRIKPDFFVNVNISAKQLERPEFRHAVENIISDTGFPAHNLCMELTERCKDFPLDALKETVEYFQAQGIRFAMDDYGTGSASSSIVMRVPMNEIKIDMSFVRGIIDNPKSQAMVHSIIDFANKSGINTCVEGVENEAIQNYLRSYHATWFQGYHYAKPSSIDCVEDMLRNSLLDANTGII